MESRLSGTPSPSLSPLKKSSALWARRSRRIPPYGRGRDVFRLCADTVRKGNGTPGASRKLSKIRVFPARRRFRGEEIAVSAELNKASARNRIWRTMTGVILSNNFIFPVKTGRDNERNPYASGSFFGSVLVSIRV